MTNTAGSVAGVPLDQVPANISGDPNHADSLQAQEAYAMNLWNTPTSGLQTFFTNTYPDLAWMLSIPGMTEILVGGAVNGWSQGIIDGLLSQNSWWQQNSQTARQWIQTQAQDPATANQEIDQNSALVVDAARTWGVQLTDAQIKGFATQASMFQWNQQEIDQHVQGAYKAPTDGSTATGGGELSDIRQVINQVSGEYITSPTTADINYWTQTAINGGQTAAQVQSELQNYLGQKDSQLHPWLASAIARGVTPKDYLQPYAQAAASTLSMSPDSINWSDPKWNAALLQTDPKTGAQNPVNLDQFNKNLMQNPTFNYSKTEGAINQAFKVANQIEQTFGKVKQ